MRLFSILVSVYNTIDYMQDALRSIVGQICVDYEVILLDDGSTDGSGSLCDAFTMEHDCSSVVHQENKGLLLARRLALQRARGSYIITLDSDDELRFDALERLRDIICVFDQDIIGFEGSCTSNFVPVSKYTPRMEPRLCRGEDYAVCQRRVCGSVGKVGAARLPGTGRPRIHLHHGITQPSFRRRQAPSRS